MDYEDIILDNRDITIDPDMLGGEIQTPFDRILPARLCIIPIRYRPIFPGIVTPLIISNGKYSEAIENVMNESRSIGLVLIKDDNKDDVTPEDLYGYGTVARILKKINLPDGGTNLLINSVRRFRINKILSDSDDELIAEVEYLDDKKANRNSKEIKALTREILGQLKMLSENNPLFTEEMKLTMINVDEPGKIADFVTTILNAEKNEYQEVLEDLDVRKRLKKVLHLLNKEMEVVSVQKKIQNNISEKIDKQQKEFFLREQLRAIRHELGMDEDERSREIRRFNKRVQEMELKGEPLTRVNEEIEKMTLMDPASSEFTVSRNFTETILSLPWNKSTQEITDLERAEKILDRDHYGLKEVKERIIEFIAVRNLNPDSGGSIICLTGPPGVGKTSLGRSIAEALNRNFYRVSLGGMRDEAEIKGHRRTYIGAMPGKIIQGMRICESMNPVFMLDEIDKLGQSFQGDPASALLEVLDPEQNREFRDHYLDIPFDLSRVLFITTANTLDTIPAVLKDRMEIIRLYGYVSHEKYEIGRRYLLPRQLKRNGLKRGDVRLTKKGFLMVIDGWAREAGVRQLERNLETLCRKTAVQIARGNNPDRKNLSGEQIRGYLGPERFTDDEILSLKNPGLSVGLAWTVMGGAILFIEAVAVPVRQQPGLKLTGQLGEVMSESAGIAFSYIRSLFEDNRETAEFFDSHQVHLHVPAGAIQKDGPSAGITMATALYSLVSGKIMNQGMAMTGELTLTGKVYPVGGIREKIIAARRYHIREILLPEGNRKDLDEIPEYVTSGIEFRFVGHMNEVVDVVFSGKKRG